jgi:hypothetical protein
MPLSYQVTLYYLRHVLTRHVRVPDIVRVDKDDGPLLVAASTDVAEDGGRRDAASVHLFPEDFEQFGAPFRATASLARGSAHEYLAQLAHAQILWRSRDKSNGGIRFQATGFR